MTEDKKDKIFTEAYSLLEHALDLLDSKFYDDALEVLKQSKELFKELNREEEMKIIEEKISEISKIKERQRTDLVTKKREDSELETQIRALVDDAERLAREYEKEWHDALKEDRILRESKYPLVIQKYKNIIKLLKDKGWEKQIPVYEETIERYKLKLKNEEKVRDLEKEKREKQEKQLGLRRLPLRDVLKIVDGESKDEILNELRKKGEEKNLDILIESIERELKFREKEYLKELKEGNFNIECPYEKIIIVYQAIQQLLEEKNHPEEASLYTNIIKSYEQKLAQDENLRATEALKLKKKEEFETLQKSKDVSPAMQQPEKIKRTMEKETLEKDESQDIDAYIDTLIKKSNELEEIYMKTIKQGNFEIECPYEEIIKNYKEIQDLLRKNNRMREASLYENAIQLYQQKLEQDKRLRETEAQKKQKREELKALQKIENGAKESEIDKRMILKTTKKEENEQFQQAMRLIEEVEKEIKEYETQRKENILEHETPYERAIEAYKTAQNILRKIGWTDEANRLNDSIIYYKEKKEKDDILRARELEKRKRREIVLEREKETRKTLKIESEKEVMEKERRIKQQQEQKAAELKRANELFETIEKANQIAREYQVQIKQKNFTEPSKYIEVIDIYEKAKETFENMGWEGEANKLNASIYYYKKKLEEENILKKQFQQEKKEKELVEKGYQLMDQALKKLSVQEFDEARNLYNKAKGIFLSLGRSLELDKIKMAMIELNRKREEYLKKLREQEEKREKLREEEKILEEKAIIERKNFQRELEKKQELFIQLKEKEQKDKAISEEALSLIHQAEEMARIYEENIKLGRRPEPVYEKVIEFYEKAIEKFRMIGWEDEILKLKESIQYYRKKSKEDKELRELERVKSREIEIEQEAYNYLEEATTMMNSNNFDAALELYKKARDLFEEINHDLEVKKVNNSILELKRKKEDYYKKLEEIKKKREKLIKEQQELEQKILLERKKLKKELEEKQQQYLQIKEREEKEKKISEEALSLINKAEEIAKCYEEELKKGKLPPECGYEEAIKLYQNALAKLKSLDWKEEIKRLEESIEYYEERLKRDKEIREIEAIKRKEAEIQKKAYLYLDQAANMMNIKNFDDALKFYGQAKDLFEQIGSSFEIEKVNQSIMELKEIKEAHEKELLEQKLKIQEKEKELKKLEEEARLQKLKIQKELERKQQEVMKALEEDRTRQAIYEQTLTMIQEAEDKAREYEEKIQNGELVDCVYGEVIELYKEAIKNFEKIGLREEIERLKEAIEFYEEKEEQDTRLREFAKISEREKDLTIKAYQLMDMAASSLKMKEFDKAIKYYEEARKIFDELSHEDEILKISISIDEVNKEREKYLEELEKIKKSKEQEEEQWRLLEEEAKALKAQIQEELKKKNEQLFEIQKQEREKKEISNRALSLITEAETMVETYEKLMKKGERPECVYPQVIENYQKAMELFTSIDWVDEAEKLKDPIAHYEEKLRKDQKIREMELNLKKKAEIAEKAYKLMDHAITAVNMKEFDEALELYQEAKNLFTSINRNLEVAKIDISIEEVKKEKEQYLLKLENLKRKKKEEQELLAQLEAKARGQRLQFQKEMAKKNQQLKQLSKIEKEKKVISENALSMIIEAEEKAENYEKALKEGKKLACVYPEVIKLLENSKKLLESIEWTEEVSRIQESIQYYKNKLEQDKKLRELEEAKKLEKELTNKGYELMEKAIIQVNMKNFDEAIELYKEALALFEKINREIEIEKITISLMELEQKKKEEALRLEKERKKKEAQLLEFQEMEARAKAERKRLQEQLKKKQEQFLAVKKREKEEKEKAENALFIINQAESLVESYEKALSNGQRPESIYPKVIELYESALQLLEEIEWKEEIDKIKEAIDYYKEKLDEDLKFRELEAKKLEEEKIASEAYLLMEKAISLVNIQEYSKALDLYEEARKKFQIINRPIEIEKIDASIEELHRIEEEKIEKLKRKRMEEIKRRREKEEFEKELLAARKKLKKEMEEKKKKQLEKQERIKREKQISEEAFSLVNKAENMVEEYHLKLSKGESPEIDYNKVIELYEQAIKKLKSINWQDEVNKLLDAIEYYKQKKKDEEILKKLELEENRKEKELEKAYTLMEKGMELFKQSKYEEVIRLYEQVAQIYKQLEMEYELMTIENLILEINEKKAAEERALKEEEKYREEIERELLERQRELTREYSEEQKRKQREKELLKAEKLKKQKEKAKAKEAHEYIDKAEELAKNYKLDINVAFEKVEQLFNKIFDYYQKAKNIFEEINWREEVKTLEETIEYYQEKLRADKEFREIETQRKKQEQEELERLEQLARMAKEREELMKKRKEKLLLKAKKIAKAHEEKKKKAFEYLDAANEELNNNNHDKARELYQLAGEIFASIDWQEGVSMINESLEMVEQRKREVEKQLKEEEQRKHEQELFHREIEEKIAELERIKQQELEQKRKELLEKQKQQKEQREIADKAFKLLEEGTRFLEVNKFDDAEARYIQARDLFGKIGWTHEISKINNESLLNLRRKKALIARSREEQRKAKELRERREKEIEKQKQIQEKALKKLRKIKIMDKFDESIQQEYEKAQEYLNSHEYNQAVLILKDVVDKLEKAGKQDEKEKIKSQIMQIMEQSRIPIITLEETISPKELDYFIATWRALDKANISLANNLPMKTISELKEAIFNMQQTQLSKKYLEKINSLMNELNIELGRKRKVPLSDAGDKSETEIQKDELEQKIQERRKQREQRILDLLKKKKIE